MDLTLYADGGTVGGSPGRGVYWSIGTAEGVTGHWETAKHRKSDEAEWLALYSALWAAGQSPEAKSVTIRMDCRPVVNAVRHRREPRAQRLKSLYQAVMVWLQDLRQRGIRVMVQWVARAEMNAVLGH